MQRSYLQSTVDVLAGNLARGILAAALLVVCTDLAAKVFPFNEQKAPQTKEDLLAIQGALVENLQRARKATVSISLGEGFGSGVIVSPEGLILTAAHVTGAVGKELTVILNDGSEYKAVSMGLVSDSDAAMMRITGKQDTEKEDTEKEDTEEEDGEKQEYPYVDINRDNDYRLGHWIFALGHSGGFDEERGPVVRLGRIVKDAETTLHTDCKVIGGDSGGPLFDMAGRLIGIHSRVSKSMEQNMHVPMREYIKHWDALEQNKFLGDGPFAQRPVKGSGFLGFGSADTDDGLLVGKVLKDGPADKAGVKAGDIIMKLDGKEIPDKETFKELLKDKATGDKVTLLVLRKGEEKSIEVKLGKK